MRPTVTEQLDGVCRILEDVIAPEIAGSHPRETLRNLVSNLRMLSRSWTRLLPFLHWDNAASTALLLAAREQAGAPLATRIDTIVASAPADLADAEAVHAYNTVLRACLSECILASCAAVLTERMAEHFADRAARYPLRLTGAQPKRPAAGGGA